MKRYIFRFTLKEEFYSNEPRHVIFTTAEMSIIAESLDTAIAIMNESFAHRDQYNIDPEILEREIGPVPA